MRSRPQAEMRFSPVHPGEQLRADLTLVADHETPIDFVRLKLTATETLYWGDRRYPDQRVLFTGEGELASAGTLPEGTNQYTARFEIPADSPASYEGAQATIAYSLALHVSIPWWPDLRESYDVRVVARPQHRLAKAPVTAQTADQGLGFLEVRLEDRAFSPGDVIEGAVAIGGVDEADGLDLSIVGFEALGRETWRKTQRVEAHRFTFCQPIEKVDEGRELSLRIQVPRDLQPAFALPSSRLDWEFEVKLERGWGKSIVCSVPIEIRSFDTPPEGSAVRHPVGSERWRALLRDVGARFGLALDDSDLALAGQLGACRVNVRPQGKGQRGTETRIEFPPWGIELRIAPRGMFSLAGGLGDPFHQRFAVQGREPVQAAGAIGARLRRALVLFERAEMRDSNVLASSPSSPRDPDALAAFVAHAVELAGAIDEASRNVPPPAHMERFVAAWEAFASDTGARFEVGRMALVDATVEGAAFQIATELAKGGAPLRTILRLAIDPPLPRLVDLEGEPALLALPPGVRQLVLRLRCFGRELAVDREALELRMAGPIADPEALREPMGELAALAQRLAGGERPGPYR